MSKSVDYNKFIYGWAATVAPGVGLQCAVPVPANRVSELCFIQFSLVTDANVANRIIYLQHETAAINIPFVSPDFDHVASTTWEYIGSRGHVPSNAAPNTRVFFNLPDHPFFYTGENCNVMCDNIQIGDQISLINVCWKFWPISP